MSTPFRAFGASHIAVVVLTVGVPLALAVIARRLRSEIFVRTIARLFAALLIATWALWYWLIAARGWVSAQTILPMELCDWATIATLATLVRPNQRSYELAYFWSLSGTLQALLTPELFYDFPDLRFVIFFAFHGGTIAAVLFLALARRLRPWPSSLPRVTGWSLAYLAIALAANRLFGTNFGYLSAKPATASLLDFLGPWPVYIAALAGLGVFYLLLLYAPYFVADRLGRRRSS